MPGGQLADGRELLGKPGAPLELLHLRQVLEQHQRAFFAEVVFQDAQRVSQHLSAAGPLRLDLAPVRGLAPGAFADPVPRLRKCEADVRQGLSGCARRIDAEDRPARPVEEDDAALGVGRQQAGGHRRDDVSIEVLQPLQGFLLELELEVRSLQLLGQVRDHERDAVEPGHRDGEIEPDARAAPGRHRRERRHREHVVSEKLHHRAVQDRRGGGHDHGARAVQEERGGSDDDQVQEVENGVGPARGVNQDRDDSEIAGELDRGGEARGKKAAERPVEDGEQRGGAVDGPQVRDLERRPRARLDQDGGQQNQEEDGDSDRRQPGDGTLERVVHRSGSLFQNGAADDLETIG